MYSSWFLAKNWPFSGVLFMFACWYGRWLYTTSVGRRSSSNLFSNAFLKRSNAWKSIQCVMCPMQHFGTWQSTRWNGNNPINLFIFWFGYLFYYWIYSNDIFRSFASIHTNNVCIYGVNENLLVYWNSKSCWKFIWYGPIHNIHFHSPPGFLAFVIPSTFSKDIFL